MGQVVPKTERAASFSLNKPHSGSSPPKLVDECYGDFAPTILAIFAYKAKDPTFRHLQHPVLAWKFLAHSPRL
jgi:hypothetical protein